MALLVLPEIRLVAAEPVRVELELSCLSRLRRRQPDQPQRIQYPRSGDQLLPVAKPSLKDARRPASWRQALLTNG